MIQKRKPSILIIGAALLVLLLILAHNTALLKDEIAKELRMTYEKQQHDTHFLYPLLYDYNAFSILLNIDLETAEENNTHILDRCTNIRVIFDGPDLFEWSENAFDVYINNESSFTVQGSGYITTAEDNLSKKDMQALSAAGFIASEYDTSTYYKRVTFYERISIYD